MMRLTLVISQLTAGGAERATSTLVNHWVERGWDVQLITFWDKASDFYQVSSGVKRTALSLWHPSKNLRQGAWVILRRLRAVRTLIRGHRPDAVISMMDTTNVLTLLATIGLRAPVIVCEHIHPAMHRIGWLRECLRRLVYPLAACAVGVSPQICEWMQANIPRARVLFIPNAVAPVPFSAGARRKDGSEHAIVAMGRLVPQKGFDLLLRAFALIFESHPGWVLNILGDGPDRGTLEALAAELGISSRTHFLGLVREPRVALSVGDLFVLSSRYEGFPYALLEAMSCGLPAVSFDCASGPKEIIRNGIDGILVPPEDVGALAAAMSHLMMNSSERQRLATRALDVGERFGLAKVAKVWEDLIREVANVPSQDTPAFGPKTGK